MNLYTRRICLMLSIGCILFVVSEEVRAQQISYEKVKDVLDRYAMADDPLGSNYESDIKAGRSLPSSATPHLIRLFSENDNDYYRQAVIDAFESNSDSYDLSVPFVVTQLEGTVESWKGNAWIARALVFLWKADRESFITIAERAKDSKDPLIRRRASILLRQQDESLILESSSEKPEVFPSDPPPIESKKPTKKTALSQAEKAKDKLNYYWVAGVSFVILLGFFFMQRRK